MIKINLMNSATDRPEGVAAIETRVSNPRTQMWVVIVAVFSLLILVAVFDYVSANSAHEKAQANLIEQQRIAVEMQRINAEIAELEQRTRDIEARTTAIRRLRAAQRGPVAVLSAINERLPGIANFRLERIQQTGTELTITGDSQVESAVTQFGRSLEFSSGLFSNVNIETQRRVLEGAGQTMATASGQTVPVRPTETVGFTIKCRYTPPEPAPATATTTTINQVAKR